MNGLSVVVWDKSNRQTASFHKNKMNGTVLSGCPSLFGESQLADVIICVGTCSGKSRVAHCVTNAPVTDVASLEEPNMINQILLSTTSVAEHFYVPSASLHCSCA
jgi:hypothetical protein